MAWSNTSHRIWRTSNNPLTIWQNIYLTRRSTPKCLMIWKTLTVLVTQSGISYLQSINLAGTPSTLTIILNLLGKKSQLNSLLEQFPWQQTRLLRLQTWSPSIKLRHRPLYWPNPRRKLIPFPNISFPTNLWSTAKTMAILSTRASHMLRLSKRPPTCWKFWKLKKRSLLSILKRSIRLTILSMVKPNLNLISRWRQRVYLLWVFGH